MGPQKEKDLSPNIFNFNLGVTNILEFDDDLSWRDGVHNCNIFAKKKGHCHKYTCDIIIVAKLYEILFSTGSQCRVSNRGIEESRFDF